MPSVELDLADEAATEGAGRALASCVQPGLVVTLHGDLGAGKTTLVRGVLRALGWKGRVKSPTYSLVEHYLFSSLYLYHFDFYRLQDPGEWDTAGFAECFRDDSVCFIEWPERVASRLPGVDVALALAHAATGRHLRADAPGERGLSCLTALRGAVAASSPRSSDGASSRT